MHHDIYSRQWQCTLKLLLVTESPEIFTDIITLIITVVTAQTSNFFQITHHLQIYQRHYWSFFKDFTIVSRFTDHASSDILQHQIGVPAKLVIPCVTTHLLASKWSLLQTKKFCCFLWSVTQFFTSASRSGHFAACVQNGVYSSLISVFLPLACPLMYNFLGLI